MNKVVQSKIIKYIDTLLKLAIWHDNKALINHECDINYFLTKNDLTYLSKAQFILLLETLQSYEDAFIHHDWLLVNKIEGLSISQANEFLKAIKSILESNILDEKLEDTLIKKYHEIKNE